ncbi:flavin reductase family protein [Flavobacterium caeni]|uniref:NADH-FMN oxidoreductase RutF, flavin reductase (DIM6/NTAB) family n=1 Tax=Flavobacterium caeni TaxID=490189 RepID=A0A1G5D7V3_9FLAO|nr:flavin reductase family protein [Flavobacterium caeni]SCY10782.1 NADH-FMN oxidoreductase RutF, flavin reductase (DIM6/NTAB) family [Flavobacterium caeni]
MQFDPQETDQKSIYKLLTGAVIPRPIGWISSISPQGIRNLAPFSFFNAVGDDPPHVVFSTVRTNDTNKDTLNNVLATREFVVNMATEHNVAQMNATSAIVAPEVDEFELAGLTALPSVKVKPARVAESPIHLECELVHHYTLDGHQHGGATLLVGKIVMFHIDESVWLDDFKINMETYRPVARLAGANYAKLGEIFSIKRPLQ